MEGAQRRTHRPARATHHILHAVHGADEVRQIDGSLASQPESGHRPWCAQETRRHWHRSGLSRYGHAHR